MLHDFAVLNAANEVESEIQDVASPPSSEQVASRQRVDNLLESPTRIEAMFKTLRMRWQRRKERRERLNVVRE